MANWIKKSKVSSTGKKGKRTGHKTQTFNQGTGARTTTNSRSTLKSKSGQSQRKATSYVRGPGGNKTVTRTTVNDPTRGRKITTKTVNHSTKVKKPKKPKIPKTYKPKAPKAPKAPKFVVNKPKKTQRYRVKKRTAAQQREYDASMEVYRAEALIRQKEKQAHREARDEHWKAKYDLTDKELASIKFWWKTFLFVILGVMLITSCT